MHFISKIILLVFNNEYIKNFTKCANPICGDKKESKQ